jgi:hypothetical protein
MSTSPAATAALAPIHQIPTVDALVERHDGFLLDIWGVIHDGRKPFSRCA